MTEGGHSMSATHPVIASLDSAAIDGVTQLAPSPIGVQRPITFAKNAFIPLTTACRYTCGYCTYYDPPGQASLLSPTEVDDLLRGAKAVGCTEALFTFGDRPDDRYTEIHQQLGSWGYDSILTYLYDCCERALTHGLLPHSNPGDLTDADFELLGPVNASMGVMLETTAEVPAHAGVRRKTPADRLETIAAAGRAQMPFTTGILVGIGEGWRDRAESLAAIAALHARYGHIQEVIIQGVVPNERSPYPQPDVETMRRVLTMARAILPAEVAIQVPPNLSPIEDLLSYGIVDLGGVSPVTVDHINPAHPWPAVEHLREVVEAAGSELQERLAIHDRYLHDPDGGWVDDQIRAVIDADPALAAIPAGD
jgi:FO synthase subunit 1